MLQAWGAWTSGRGRGAPGRRPGRLSGASHLQRRCLLHPRGRGTQTPPSLRPAWYLGLERTQVGGPGRRALTCYRNWHQVSREEGAQRTRIVGGASAPLIGDCTPRSAGSPELAPLLPPPARPARQQGRSPAGRAPGRLTGGAGPPAGRGGAWGGATAGRPPTCDGPGPIRAVRPSTQGKGLWGGACSGPGLFLRRAGYGPHSFHTHTSSTYCVPCCLHHPKPLRYSSEETRSLPFRNWTF